MRPDRRAWGMLPRIGFPSASGQAMSAVGFTVQQGLVNSLGMAAIVVFGVGSRLFSLFDVPAFGIGNATSVLVGHAIGAGDASLARKTITSSLLTILLLEMPLPSVAMLAGGDLVRLWHIRLPVAYSLAWWTGFDPFLDMADNVCVEPNHIRRRLRRFRERSLEEGAQSR